MIILVLGLSCNNNLEDGSGISKISYGTSFGMCIGYCINTLVIDSETIKYSRSGRSDTIETITHTEVFDSWEAYTSDTDTVKFFELANVLGCPDCADGGAEWVEIEVLSGKKHKVTFEYMNEPAEVKELVISLREKIDELKLMTEK